MKHLFLFILFFTVISCTKDETNPDVNTSLNADLVGTWQLTATMFSDGGSSADWLDIAQADSHIVLLKDNCYHLAILHAFA